MKTFFGNELLLDNESSKIIYENIKSLPIIDYHCHLDQNLIADDASFSNIGELWLAKDHYKWRAMRLAGVSEEYITGNKSFEEKFIKYAEILPKLAGNALYYWTHMELSQIFGINEPLNKDSAKRIYDLANEKLKDLSVVSLLKKFNVEYIATTDDPIDDLNRHGIYDGIKVSPTFRPDKVYSLDDEYISKLANVSNIEINSIYDLLKALENRLDYFVSKGCRISDHGFERFPKEYASSEEAKEYYERRNNLSSEEKDKLFGYILINLTKMYAKRNMIMQIHFSVIRNNNPSMFKVCGVDSGFDLIGEEQSVKDLVKYFAQINDEDRPETIIYTLNDSNLASLAAVSGAFRNVKMGAAWWFNDTVEGIRKNLKIISEYSLIGTNYGMLTDSRSFSSYVRFDFYRRILASYLGDLVDKGEFDLEAAKEISKDICYNNIRSKIYG